MTSKRKNGNATYKLFNPSLPGCNLRRKLAGLLCAKTGNTFRADKLLALFILPAHTHR